MRPVITTVTVGGWDEGCEYARVTCAPEVGMVM